MATPAKGVENATRTIDFYRDLTKGDHEPATNMADLISDLLHWCDVHDIDVDAVVERAIRDYEAEAKEAAGE